MTTISAEPTVLHDERRLTREHKVGMAEVVTRLTIMSEELRHLPDSNPVDHVVPRLKSAAGLRGRMGGQGLPVDGSAGWDRARSRIRDVAHPEPSGDRSLHAIVQVPVFLAAGSAESAAVLLTRPVTSADGARQGVRRAPVVVSKTWTLSGLVVRRTVWPLVRGIRASMRATI